MADIRMCDECGIRPAVYYTTTVINGVANERYLCEVCKKKHGFIKPDIPFFDSLFEAFGMPVAERENVRRNDVCPTCGCSASNYLKTGFLGCPDCYKTFEKLILDSVGKIQKDTKHTGKSPDKFYSPEEAKYNELLRKREEAVAVEDYKLAAKINEEMKKLKATSAQGGEKNE